MNLKLTPVHFEIRQQQRRQQRLLQRLRLLFMFLPEAQYKTTFLFIHERRQIMKYYKYDKWLAINSQDEKTRTQAQQEWLISDCEYSVEFDRISHLLSVNFLNSYYKYKGFHDWLLESVIISKKNEGESICRILLKKESDIIISVSGFDNLYLNQDENSKNLSSENTVGYVEFTEENQYVNFSLLSSWNTEINIRLKKSKVNKCMELVML